MNKRIRNRRGFSLAEVLTVTAIVVILCGVAFAGVINHLRSMNQLEKDGIAKEIFVAAQNHLSAAESQGYLGLLSAENRSSTVFGAEELSGGQKTGVYYYIVNAASGSLSTDPNDQSSFLSRILPFASVDDTVRLGGSYIIRYQREPALVLDVFYSNISGRFNHSFTSDEYDALIANFRDTTDGTTGAAVSRKQARRNYSSDKSVIGWYGGEEGRRLNIDDSLKAPTIDYRNAERLQFFITDPNTGSSTGIRLVIEGLTSEKTKYYDLDPTTTPSFIHYDSASQTYTVTLDDVTRDGGHFYDILGREGFIPGENIKVYAQAVSTTALTNLSTTRSAEVVTNSIFGDATTTAQAEISNIRHLENLDRSISNLDANDGENKLNITAANQTADLSWPDFLTEIKNRYPSTSGTTWPSAGDPSVCTYTNAGAFSLTNAGCYKPVSPDYALTSYAGNNHSVTGVVVDTQGNAGMFGALSGTAVSNLELIDFDVNCQNGNQAGALIGSATDCAVSGVLARNSDGTEALEISGATGSVGGLIGSMSGGSVSECAAAVYVRSASGSAGGLIGSVTNGTVSSSYSGGHTENDGVYSTSLSATGTSHVNVVGGTNVGGLIGSMSGASSVSYSYSTSSVSGNAAGGLVGSAVGGSIANSYSVGLVLGSGSEPKTGAFAGSVSGTSLTGTNRYFEIINEGMATVGDGSFSGAETLTELDENLKTYNEFIRAKNADDTKTTAAEAVPYDLGLLSEFKSYWDMQTVQQLGGSSAAALTHTHYGDWPSPETKFINYKTVSTGGTGGGGAGTLSAGVGGASVVYTVAAGLPEDVGLRVSALTSGREAYLNAAAELMGLGADYLGGAELLDISLVSGGAEVQPDSAVTVALRLNGDARAEDLQVIHFGREPEPVAALLSGSNLVFRAESFSVYAVVRSPLKAMVRTEQGEVYRVALSCGPETLLPENARLSVRVLTAEDEDYRDYVDDSVKALDQDAEDVEYIRAFDVRIIDPATGEELLPTEDMKLSIRLLDDEEARPWLEEAPASSAAEAAPEARAAAPAESEGEKQEAESGTKAADEEETTAEPETVTGTVTADEAEAETEIETEPKAEAEAETEIETEAEAEAEAETETETAAESETATASAAPRSATADAEERRLDKELYENTEFSVVSFGEGVGSSGCEKQKEGLEFSAEGGPVFVLVGTTLKRTVEATDGSVYAVTVRYGKSAGIPDGAQLSVRELGEDDEGYADYMARAMELLGADAEALRLARAFDISLVDPATGEEYQPDSSVRVGIRLLDVEMESDGRVGVVHFGDESAEIMDATLNGEAIVFETDGFSVYVIIEHEGDTTVETPRVEFHFIDSVYHTNAETGYGTLNEGEYQADHFHFVNKANTVQTTQILKDGESLEMILNPPNREVTVDNGDGTTSTKTQYFFGWYLVTGRIADDGEQIIYTWTVDPEQISMEQPITIDPAANGTVGETVDWEIDGVSGTAVLDSEGTAHVFLAPVYEDYYFISYHLGPKENDGLSTSLLARSLVVLGNDEQVTARIGGIAGVSPDAKHQVFSGWETVNAGTPMTTRHYYRTVDNEGTERDYSTGVSPYYGETANEDGKEGYYAVFRKEDFSEERDVDLYPVFAESRWLYFNTGKSGNGATYVAAAYRLTNDDDTGTYFDSSFFSADRNQTRRNGYIFGGWYVDVNQVDGEITNLTEAKEVVTHYIDDVGDHTVTETLTATKLVNADGTLNQFVKTVNGEKIYEVTSDGKLYFYKAMDELTVYALWEPYEDTTVQVNVWRQKVTDDKDAADADKTYDYVRDYSYKVGVSTGSTLAQLRSANKLHVGGTAAGANVEALTEQGFSWKKTTMSTSTVKSDGSTVVDVYYDRDLITFNFYTYGKTEYAETTADTPTEQYALINGEYVLLTRDSGTQVTAWTPQYTYTSTTADGTDLYGLVDGEYMALTQVPHTETRVYYTYSTGGYYSTDVEYTDTFYTRSGNTYTPTEYNGSNLPPDDSTTYYGLTGTNYWGDPQYNQLTRRTGSTTTYSYTYNSNGTATDYPGTRYTRTSGGDMYTGMRFTKDGAAYTPTTGETGTQYGVDANGGHVRLTKGTVTVYKWSIPVYGDVYTETTATTGELYGKVGEKYYLLTPVTEETHTYTTQYTYTANNTTDGTRYGIVNGEYVQLTMWTRFFPDDGYSYTQVNDNDNDPQKYGTYNGEMVPIYRKTSGTGRGWYRTYNNGTYSNSYNGSAYVRDTATTSDNIYGGNVYYIQNGTNGFTQGTTGNTLYGRSGTNNNYTYFPLRSETYWTYGSGNGTEYTGQRYERSAGAAYTGERLLRSGSSAPYTYTATTEHTGTQYMQDANTGPDGSYGHVALNRTGPSPTLVGYTYVDDDGATQSYALTETRYTKGYGETGETVEYTGIRWEKKTGLSNGWHLYKRFTGLYGQTLKQCGYVWDETYDWYSTGGNNGSTSGTRTTFLDAFLPTAKTTVVNFYGKSPEGSRKVYFYKQKLNADGTLSAEYELVNAISTDATGFNLSDKYDGFTCYAWKTGSSVDYSASGVKQVGELMNQSGNYYYDAEPTQSGYQTASFSGTNLHIYFNRKLNSITFVTQYPGIADLWDEGGTPSDDAKTVYNIPYEASIASYGPGGANYWQPNVPPHYTFQGWYEDAACTVPYNFNTTMPAGDKIVYGGWKAQKFRVRIDPNGAEIDHIDHNWDNDNSDPSKQGYTNYWWTGDRWGSDPDAVSKAYSPSAYNSSWVPFATFNRAEITKTDEDSNVIVEREADRGYRTDQATYFNATYNEMVGEYTLTREYVPMSDAVADAYEADGGTVYYYINTQAKATDGSSLPSDLRNALYVTRDELDDYYAFYRDWVQGNLDGGYITGTTLLDRETWEYTYVSSSRFRAKYPNENYEFLGWFRVYRDDAGNETRVDTMPYNFSDPVKEPLELRAYWRLDGGYRILYTPMFTMGDGTIINGDLTQWEDPRNSLMNYADGAATEVLQQPTGLTANNEPTNEFIFRGWRLVSMNTDGSYTALENGVYYDPGEPITVHADFADKNGIIRMQAVYEPRDSAYRRPHITNLALDANGGFLTLNGTDRAENNFGLTDTWTGVIGTVAGTVLDENNAPVDRIEFGDIQSNEVVHLYRYATSIDHVGGVETNDELDPAGTNYFKHPEGHFLLGFDDSPTEGDYIATYPADSMIAVTRNDEQTIYAVWEPLVYLTVVNDTGVGPVTFSLSSADDGTLQIVNTAEGLYGRTSLTDLGSITVAEGETKRFAIPMGKNKHITLSGTNQLGVGYLLSAESELNGTARALTGSLTGSADDFTEVKNTKRFGLTDVLVEDVNGIKITFTAKKNPHTLVLDDNYAGGDTQEIYFSETPGEDSVVYYQDETETSYTLPSTSTRIGYEFLGWDEDPDAETPTYTTDHWTIPDLKQFFGGEEVKTLYAIWKINVNAQTVYVYKEVPAPGSQEKEFRFTVAMTANYSFTPKRGSGSNTVNGTPVNGSISETGTYILRHGEYLKIVSEKKIGNETTRSYMQSVVEMHAQDGTLVSTDTLRWEWSGWGETTSQGYNNGYEIQFNSQFLSVTEDDYSGDHYDTAVNVTGNFSATYPLTGSDADRRLSWPDTDAGGTAVFRNTRQTATVTVKKVLESDTNVSKQFNFSAGYILTENINGTDVTTPKDFGSFSVFSGSAGYELADIPVGAVLTVTEHGTELCDYTTTVVWGADTPAPAETETTEGGVTTYHRAVSGTVVNADTDLIFTNTLKTYKVTLYKLDQDGNTGVPSYFKLSNEHGVMESQLYGYNGEFYSNEDFYAGEYTLEETFTSTNYVGLLGPITLKVTGANGGSVTAVTAAGDEAKVIVSGNATDGFEVRVYNIRTVKFNIAKVMNDAILSTSRVFYFDVSYSYTLNGSTVNVNLSGTDAVEVESGHSAAIKVPVGATGLTIAEDTARLANATDTIAQTYTTTCRYNSLEPSNGAVFTRGGTVAVADDGSTVTFTNTRKTVNVTIKKTVIADDTNGTFKFTVTVLNGALPIRNFTVYDGGTSNDDSDDWVTDSSGVVKLPGNAGFTLTHNQSRTITIPVGASVTLREVLTTEQAEKYAVFITMPGGSENLLSGTSDAFRLLGPTEDKTIRVFNIPSICKVTDGNETLLYFRAEGGSTPDTGDDIYIPAIYGTIHGAFDHINAHALFSKSGSTYTPYYGTSDRVKYQVQMLVDYEVPNTDVVTVNPGFDITFTTAELNATDGYPFRRTGEYPLAGELGVPEGESKGRAVLTRVAGSTKAFFTINPNNAPDITTFKMSELILDGDGDEANLDNDVKGGCLTAYQSDVTIDHCVVYNFKAKQGGAVYTTGDSLTVKDSVFDSCISLLTGNGNGGGAINTTADTVLITASQGKTTTFRNCTADWQGGAVYHHGGYYKPNGSFQIDDTGKDKTLTLKQCVFENCVSRSGGGVEADVGTVTVSDCAFIRCVATARETTNGLSGGNGGGLNNYTSDFDFTGTVSVSNTSFEGCKTTAGDGKGGGLRINAKSATVTNCSFKDSSHEVKDSETNAVTTVVDHCEAKLGGGAAFDNGNSSVTVKGCTFENCTASENGGGVYSVTVSLTVQDDTSGETAKTTAITGCSAKNGGGVYSESNTTVDGASKIADCVASSNGGGVYVKNKNLTLAGTATILGHETLAEGTQNANTGGGVYITGGAMTMSGSAVIDGCSVNTSNSGGGVYLSSATLTMSDSAEIRNNRARTGAGVFAGASCSVTLNGGGINANTASFAGGAIRVESGASVNVTGGTISNNVVQNTSGNLDVYAAGISIKNGNVTISGGTVSRNRAVNNRSGRLAHGAAIYLDTGTLNISGGTISDNEATVTSGNACGGAVFVKSGATMNLSGGTISGNTVTANTAANAKGGGIYLEQGSHLNISGSPSFGGADTDDSGSFASGAGNLRSGTINGTNGGKTYTQARQDIYLVGYAGNLDDPGCDAPTIVVTGALGGDTGSIWVWAEQFPHYVKDQQFANVAGSAAPGNLAVFRDARPDGDTQATSSPLYGVPDPDNALRVIWGTVGGAEVSFTKLDGSGNALPGASFSLYTDAACTAANIVTLTLENGTAATSVTSAADGRVFFRVPIGTYYMKETAPPDGYTARTEVFRVTAAANNGSVIRVYDADSDTVVGEPLTAIVNDSETGRKVILKKVNETLDALDGASLTILRPDGTEYRTVTVDDNPNAYNAGPSGHNGAFYVGSLPYGVWYLREDVTPTGYTAPAAGKYYKIVVSAAGVTAPVLESVTFPVTAP